MPNHDKIQALIQQGTELLNKRSEPAERLLRDIALVASDVQELQKQKAALIKRRDFLQNMIEPFPGIYDELMQLLVSMPEKDKIPLQILLASCMPCPQTPIPQIKKILPRI